MDNLLEIEALQTSMTRMFWQKRELNRQYQALKHIPEAEKLLRGRLRELTTNEQETFNQLEIIKKEVIK